MTSSSLGTDEFARSTKRWSSSSFFAASTSKNAGASSAASAAAPAIHESPSTHHRRDDVPSLRRLRLSACKSKWASNSALSSKRRPVLAHWCGMSPYIASMRYSRRLRSSASSSRAGSKSGVNLGGWFSLLAPVDAPGESPRLPLGGGAPAGGAGRGTPVEPAGDPVVVAFFAAAIELSNAEMSPPPPCTMDASIAPAFAGGMPWIPDWPPPYAPPP